MKRQSVGRTNALVTSSDGEQGFWPSYADMMSALALILFFLMLLSYIQNLITGNDLQNTQEVLADTRIRLEETLTKVDDAEAALKVVTADLEGVSASLDEAQLTLKEKTEEIESYAKQISGQEKEIKQQQEMIDWQKDYLAAANDEILTLRSQMQTIAVLRLSILDQIQKSIVSVMGDASKVSIGENGSIILNEGVLFDLGSSAIKPESKPVLNQLIKVFTTFLSDSENAKYVDSIVISGHTDITGTAEENRKLSTERANSVLSYLLTGDNATLEKYSEYFCAAGYGATRPVASNDTEKGRASNRRIEISMILKDETVLDIVEKYLEADLPDSVTVKASAAPSASPSAYPYSSPRP